MITIEEVGPECSKLLAELSCSTFLKAYKDTHSRANMESYCSSHYSEQKLKQDLSRKNTVAVIAFSMSEPSGFYVLKHHTCPIVLDGQASELKQIYVMPDHYGKGLGLELFTSAVEKVRLEGSRWLWLCVSDKNHRAKAFYNKLGFSSVGKGPDLEVGADTLSSSILCLEL